MSNAIMLCNTHQRTLPYFKYFNIYYHRVRVKSQNHVYCLQILLNKAKHKQICIHIFEYICILIEFLLLLLLLRLTSNLTTNIVTKIECFSEFGHGHVPQLPEIRNYTECNFLTIKTSTRICRINCDKSHRSPNLFPVFAVLFDFMCDFFLFQ